MAKPSSLWQQFWDWTAPRLSEGDAEDTLAARVLHRVLIGVLIFEVFYFAIGLPFFVVRKSAAAALAVLLASAALISLFYLRQGRIRLGSRIFLAATLSIGSILTLLSGGFTISALACFLPITVMATWLLGQRVALVLSGVLVASALALAILTKAGHHSPSYFPVSPMAGWMVLLFVVTLTVLPLSEVLRTIRESLEQAQQQVACLKQAEHDLKLSQQRLALHVQQTPLAAIEFNIDGRVREWNPAAAKEFGYSREEAIGQHWTFIVPEEVHSQLDGVWKSLVTQGGGNRSTNENRTKNGQRITCEWFNTPLIDPSNKAIGAASLVMNVTERKRAEEEIRSLAEFPEENPNPVIRAFRDGSVLYANQPALRLLELMGWQAGHSLPKELLQQARRVLERGEKHEFDLLCPGGRTFTFTVAPSSRVNQVNLYASDNTERKGAENALKESKEYLNQIINRISDQLFVTDREHKFILVNDASCEFNGQRREELLGKMFVESIPKELELSLWEHDEEVFETGRESLTEDTVTDWQGNSRTFMTKKSLFTDKSGNKQIICVLREITEYKRLQAQFLQAQKMEAVGILAGGVAHDFNNLLNVINGYSELVLEVLAQDNPIRRDIEQVREAGQRAATLTSQLLAFSRKQILQPEILDLNNAITDMSSMLRRLIGENIEFVCITHPGLGLVNADPGQIQQIVMNLAVNARDAMPQGGKLTIETANVDLDEDHFHGYPAVKAGPYVMLAINDNGIGMDATTQARIFEP